MNIVLGITGSIAAYKACTLIRLFVKAGHEVQVVITPAGKEFITPLTLSTLSRHAVVSEFFDRRDGSWHSHVDLGLWADAMVIAPATAATIGKMAHGIADNMLLTTYMSMKAPVFIAPAMDLDMYRHPATQANLRTLQSYGHTIIEPAEGELASALVGKGRMEEPENIFKAVMTALNNPKNPETPEIPETPENLENPEIPETPEHPEPPALPITPATAARGRLLITAGPTYERLDPVRFIGNYSTGKMGFALAEAAARAGYDVELIAGPVNLPTPSISCETTADCSARRMGSIHRTNVESAAEMHAAATRLWPECSAAILCAAVADFTPAAVADEKIKRETTGEWRLDLVPTQDIARCLGEAKRANQHLIGFALETTAELQHATEKMQRKHLDMIVMNSLRDAGAGFGYDTNKVTFLFPDGRREELPLKSKADVANDIIQQLCAL